MKAIHPSKLISAGACLVSAALFLALPAFAQSAPSTRTPNAPTRPMGTSLNQTDRQFIMKAAQSDMTEIMTSRLALQRSQNPQVRQFAQQMIDHHTASSRRLMPIAQRKGVMMPRDMGPENRALMNQLTKLSGAQFDRAYMQGQLAAHTRTEAVYRQELQQGQDRDVKAFANQVLPVVAGHRQMAESMVANR